MGLLKIALSITLVWLCLRSIGAADVLDLLARLPFTALAACLAFLAGHTLLSAWRWRLVCRALALPAPAPPEALRWTALGVTLSQVLPSTVGGDAYRIGAFARRQGFSAAARSVIHDRLGGLWVLGVLACCGALPALHLAGAGPGWFLLVACGAVGLGAAACLRLPFLPREAQAFFGLLRMPGLVWTCVAIHGMTLGAFAVLAAGLQPGSGLWWQAALVAPAVMLVAAVPVSLGGWGVRETAMVLALGALGVEKSGALAISLAYGAMMLFTGALCAVAWLVDRTDSVSNTGSP